MERHHNVTDFDGSEGRRRAAQIVEAAVAGGFTQILGPAHLLNSANNQWLRRDIAMMSQTADEIAKRAAALDLIYPLAVPMALMRNVAERRAIIAALAEAPCSAMWLKVENFGDDATGGKIASYVDACRDFHERGLPLVGDHVGGLPALAALAFGAVGGIAHGVTMQQNFRASGWRRPPVVRAAGGPVCRVYIPPLDLLLKPELARALFAVSPRIKALCGCRDMHCCPHGMCDMLDHPARHATYRRAREVEHLGTVPERLRPGDYLNQTVRRVSDKVAHVAAAVMQNEDLAGILNRKQQQMSRFRQVIAHLAETGEAVSFAVAPLRRHARRGG